jgi:hypothetical protein
LDAPVTSATLPVRSFISSVLRFDIEKFDVETIASSPL